jgi:hypothetical protein
MKRIKKSRGRKSKFVNFVPENTESEKSNQRDIALLEHGWSPQETKFGEPFKGKNKIMIAEEK